MEELSIDERDLFVGNVYKQLMEIESRLLPCGLHTIGEAPTAEEAVATLVNIASLEREQEGLRSLPGLLAESIGLTIEQIYDGNNKLHILLVPGDADSNQNFNDLNVLKKYIHTVEIPECKYTNINDIISRLKTAIGLTPSIINYIAINKNDSS